MSWQQLHQLFKFGIVNSKRWKVVGRVAIITNKKLIIPNDKN
jgi:hypothetical protein